MAAVSIGIFTNAYGVFYSPLSKRLQVGRGMVAVHATIAGLLTGILGPVAVRLYQRINSRILIAIGVIILAISTWLIIPADRIWMLNVIGILRGIGCSLLYIPALTLIIGNWFRKYYGTVLGITFSFSGISGAVLSPVFSRVVDTYGCEKALMICTVLVMIFALPGILFCRFKPSEIGMPPLGEEEDLRVKEEVQKRKEDNHADKKKMTILMCVIGFLAVFVSGFTQHMSGYSESIGMGTTLGVQMMSCAMVGNIVFKLLSGIWTDLFGTVKTVNSMFVITGTALLIFLFHPQNTVFMLMGAFLFGSVYSFGAVGLAAVTKEIFGETDFGNAYALISMFTCVGASVSLTVIGALYDKFQNYIAAIGILILFCLISIIGICCSMHEKSRH